MSGIVLSGDTSGTVALNAPTVAGTQSYTLPTAVPAANGYALTSTTAGVMSWAATSGGTPGGSNTQIQFNNSSAFGGSANFTWDGTNAQIGATGALRFADSDSSNYVAFKAPASIGSNVNWTLPSTDGTAGQVLSTNGSGVLSWVTVTITPTSPTNNTLPVVSGTPTVGQTLSSTSGTWNGYPAPTFAYQWVRGASTNISGATSSSYTLVDADYNNTVKCTVTATNSAGSASATSAATATVAGSVPGAPTIGTATPGNTQASVAFTAPASTGGPAITSYTATSSPGGFTATGSASPLTVTGLTNGTAYTFTVTATNSIGTSAASAASNSVTPALAPSSVEYLIVSGGGGGGGGIAAGGGAGGYLTGTASVSAGTPYTTTVGAGGAGFVGNGNGTNGSTSTTFSLTPVAGGGGGGFPNGGNSGGSGGGGAYPSGAGGAGTSGQGFAGGVGGSNVSNRGGGGGGGGGGVGAANPGNGGGNGGVGVANSITGSSLFYCGGGGGGSDSGTPGAGGSSIGGAGSTVVGVAGNPGTTNTGSGGGGGGTSGNGGLGGSGVVIIAYPDSFAALSSVGGGLTYSVSTTSRTGYRVYTFTAGTGTIQW